MATTTKTRRPASKARREAARARDAELAAKAAAALADPQIGERIAALVTTPGILRYSLRNQALLLSQADERGMTLTDVDTYRGWKARGRQVRAGEHGLKINRPVGREQADEETGQAAAEEASDEGAEKVRFRTMTVFDISQTDGVEDVDDAEAAGGEAETEPAVTLFESLTTQAERAGYLVTVHPADEPHRLPVDVDDEANTINIYDDGDPRVLSQFAGAVAAILAARAKEAKPSGPATPSEISLTVA